MPVKFQLAGTNTLLEVEIADTFFSRLRGLMGRKPLPPGYGLLLIPCNNIHMCFMRFAIDVIYLDKEYRVQKIVEAVPPWIGLSMCLGAYAALEMNAGEAERLGIKVGHTMIRR